jgi:glycosyltransferase involved in cell wall biosynthesis
VRVAYELTSLELDMSGSARYVRGLLAELTRRADAEVFPISHKRFRGGPGPSHRVVRGLTRELGYLPFGLPRALRSVPADILHCPAPVAPHRSPLPLAITVHDMLAWDHPEWLARVNVAQLRLVLPRVLRRADVVLTGSEFSRTRLAAALEVDPAKIRVTPYGLDARFTPGPRPEELLARLGVRGPYVLTVGTLQPRKNVEALLRASAGVRSGGVDHEVVVVGARGWLDDDLLEQLNAPALKGAVHVTGRVTDAELVDLYRGAELFVFPSRYEGFGFPVLEAMACGTAVVAADRASLPELVGESGALVDPDDPKALEECLGNLLSEPGRRNEYAAAGLRRAAEFTWERCADLTVDAYRSALAAAPRRAAHSPST